VCLDAFDDSYAILDGAARFKLHHHRGKRYEALYDLRDDPAETRNRILVSRDEADSLRALLDDWLWQGRDSWANPWHYRGPPSGGAPATGTDPTDLPRDGPRGAR